MTDWYKVFKDNAPIRIDANTELLTSKQSGHKPQPNDIGVFNVEWVPPTNPNPFSDVPKGTIILDEVDNIFPHREGRATQHIEFKRNLPELATGPSGSRPVKKLQYTKPSLQERLDERYKIIKGLNQKAIDSALVQTIGHLAKLPPEFKEVARHGDIVLYMKDECNMDVEGEGKSSEGAKP